MITLNGVKINPTIFPDKTSQVWKIEKFPDQVATVVWEFENEGELMHLAQLKLLLDSKGIKANLKIPFLPYARQDKEVENDRTFALISFARLLNTLKFESVESIDVHSSAANSLIENFHSWGVEHYIAKSFRQCGADLIVYPDLGAKLRYSSDVLIPCVFAVKERNQESGRLIYHDFGDETKAKLANKNVLVVDDICDGGATFVMVADKLREAGVNEMNLYVSHGLFSKGTRPLKNSGYNKIYTKEGEVL